jgi:hypothetical protein
VGSGTGAGDEKVSEISEGNRNPPSHNQLVIAVPCPWKWYLKSIPPPARPDRDPERENGYVTGIMTAPSSGGGPAFGLKPRWGTARDRGWWVG